MSAVTFQGQINHGVEQEVARADEGGEWLTGRGDRRLLKSNSLVTRRSGSPIPITRSRMATAACVISMRCTSPFFHRTAEAFEGLQEKRFDVMGLETPRLGAFHVLADAMHAAGIHRIVGQRPFLQQIPKLALVKNAIYHLRQAGAHLRLFAITDGADQEFPQ